MEHGIKEPHKYRDMLIHDWFLNDEIKKQLEEFTIKIIYTKMLFDRIKDGEIELGQKVYQIIWIHKPETIRKNERAVISFRFSGLLNCGYALIKKYEYPEHIDLTIRDLCTDIQTPKLLTRISQYE